MYTTTSSSLVDRLDQILWADLPKTFRDAVIVTRSLGVRYLWIDSICIIQDSRPDWERESACMEEIYRKAYLTIAASASPDNSTGFLTSRASSSLNGPWGPTNPKYISIKSKIKHHSTPETDPLSTRAWAYQERLMASRILSLSS